MDTTERPSAATNQHLDYLDSLRENPRVQPCDYADHLKLAFRELAAHDARDITAWYLEQELRHHHGPAGS